MGIVFLPCRLVIRVSIFYLPFCLPPVAMCEPIFQVFVPTCTSNQSAGVLQLGRTFSWWNVSNILHTHAFT